MRALVLNPPSHFPSRQAVAKSSKLPVLFQKIRVLHAENIIRARQTAEAAIRIGVWILQVKEAVNHGEFQDVLKSEVPGLSYSCAANYTRLVKRLMTRCIAVDLMRKNSENAKNPSLVVLDGPACNAQLSLNPSIPPVILQAARAEVSRICWSKVEIQGSALLAAVKDCNLSQLYSAHGILPKEKVIAKLPAGVAQAASIHRSIRTLLSPRKSHRLPKAILDQLRDDARLLGKFCSKIDKKNNHKSKE